MADKFLSKINVGTDSYKLKDSVLNSIGLAVKGIADVSENASTEDLAKKMNEILSKFRSLTCLAVCCGISVFGALFGLADDPVQPLKSQHKYIKGEIEVVTNEVEWITYITNNLPQSIDAKAVTNISDYVSEQKVNRKPCWTKEGGWMLDYQLDASSETITHTEYATNAYYQIFKHTWMTVKYSLSADLFLNMLDEYAKTTPVITNYVCQTGGGTITSAGHLTATSNGIYTCWAQANDGQSGKVNVPLNTTIQGTAEKNIYNADVAGTERKAVNDEALSLINGATAAGTVIYDGKTYYKWNYFTQPAWAATSAGIAGNHRQFAIGTKLMVGASHYAWLTTGEQTVGSTTVTKGSWEKLYTWALNNGWTAEELKKMGIGDISICVLTSGTIPLTDLPYLMSEEQFNTTFQTKENEEGKGLNGVQGWCAVQGQNEPVPLTFSLAGYGTTWGCSQESSADWVLSSRRADINTAFVSKGACWPIHAGDSGHPIYFRKNGKYVLASHFHFTSGGPSYIKTLPVLKAYAAAHGSQLRLWDEP